MRLIGEEGKTGGELWIWRGLHLGSAPYSRMSLSVPCVSVTRALGSAGNRGSATIGFNVFLSLIFHDEGAGLHSPLISVVGVCNEWLLDELDGEVAAENTVRGH